ncbi:hypothetical protein A9Q73_11440 [Bermanella sp. 47_1433_sub80_T6]|uniref:Uncharacterized protein n=1 Tax=Oleispira antarctica TaxID=188908 RepID=A0A1Y5HTI4_OLEAN|nr:hypothetical protein A9Q73_11440 [Bermanella sp. 47_1433_sub80_T6]OUS40589.1 hypothetical protein A9R00_05255 [Oleispira antarctica]
MTDQPAENPYSAPTSQVENVNANGEVIFCEAKKLTAGQGSRMVADAWRIYKVSPFKWTFIAFSLFAVMMLLSIIPLVGSFVGSLVYTPLFAGLLIGASEIEKGGKLKFGHLFSAIKSNPKGVFGLAVVVTFIGLINMALAFSFMGFELFMATYMGQELDPASLNIDPANMMIGGIIMFAGTALIMMLAWFATPLIALQSKGVFQAMAMSFKASLKNWLPLTVYGLIMAFWMIVAVIPVGLGLLIMIPLLTITIYTTYRKIFTE